MPYAPPISAITFSSTTTTTTATATATATTLINHGPICPLPNNMFDSSMESAVSTIAPLSPATSPSKSSTTIINVEKKSQPVDMKRQRAVQELKDILSTSPHLSTSPRRNSSPETYSRRPLLKVDLPPAQTIEILRKKSGEVVKPSLKKGSKSAPVTPTCPKYVHFDTDLEEVRWFLEAEKPQAVSCDASSEEEEEEESDENEFSESGDDYDEGELVITLPNFPRITTLHSSKPVFVECIFLSANQRKLQGRIQVQNIAFHKTVVIRYTFDFWQTVSEIQATYLEAGQDRKKANFDVFVFGIDLIDNSRNPISGQTMYFAVRYNVNNRDYWDNNNGSNYQVNFKRQKQPPPPPKSRGSKSKSYSKWSSTSRKSINDDELGRSPPSLAASPKSSHMTSSQSKKLTNRYDINSSLSAAMTKTTSQPSDSSSSTRDNDGNNDGSSNGSSSRSVALSSRPHPIVPTSSQSLYNHHIRSYSYFPTGISYSNDSFNSYFPGNCIDGMPGTMDSLSPSSSSSSSLDVSRSSTTPITIPRPATGTMSYYELLDRYCFSCSPPVTT